jgi:uncharacterized protein
MPEGKLAGVRCVQLSDENLCLIFGKPERPAVCEQFGASFEICGNSPGDALDRLAKLEVLTKP